MLAKDQKVKFEQKERPEMLIHAEDLTDSRKGTMKKKRSSRSFFQKE